MLIAILRGNYSEELVNKGYDKLKTFGVGRDIPQKDWQDYLLQILNHSSYYLAQIIIANAKVNDNSFFIPYLPILKLLSMINSSLTYQL